MPVQQTKLVGIIYQTKPNYPSLNYHVHTAHVTLRAFVLSYTLGTGTRATDKAKRMPTNISFKGPIEK
jgi:hypothetical protein